MRGFLWLARRWGSIAAVGMVVVVAMALIVYQRNGNSFALQGIESPLTPVVFQAPGGGNAAGGAQGNPFPRRLPAPSLDGGVEWLNAAGPVDLKDLRGKFVLLDFWTYCCINCMHVLPELKKLEHKYPNNVVVIGVHSAKFETEKDSDSIRQAILRYEIEHPVINDANQVLWRKYLCESWPSLRMIDPEGNLVAMHSGEIRFETLDEFMKQSLPWYRQRKLLDERPVHFDLERHRAAQTPLRFPGKVLADEAGGRLFIADSNHNRIVVAPLAGPTAGSGIYTIGSGKIGAADGDFATAEFNHPQGMALDGETLYVADTENHLLRKVDLRTKKVTTIAGTGSQAQNSWGGVSFDVINRRLPSRYSGKPKTTALASPWALWVHGKMLYIAMAGPHQIWRMPLDESEIGPYAGNGREDIVDGPLLPKTPYETGYSSFAQPSGLSSDGTWLYVADSEGSSIRAVPFAAKGKVRTVVGTAHLPHSRLFTFGDTDGDATSARLQHCLEVVYRDDKLYLADTYNHKIKVFDLKTEQCTTLVGAGQPGKDDAADGRQATFFEPAGLAYANGKLYVADTNNHLIRVVELGGKHAVSTLPLPGLRPPKIDEDATSAVVKKPNYDDAQQVQTPKARLKPDANGNIHLLVKLALPQGYKINPNAPLRYYVETNGENGPIDRAALDKLTTLEKPAAEFDVSLPIAAGQQASPAPTTIRLSLRYYYCQDGAEGLCKIGSVSFNVPIQVAANAAGSSVELPLQVE